MAYSLPPWELEKWPSVWLYRSLAVLEPVDEAPPFGQLAHPPGAADAAPPTP